MLISDFGSEALLSILYMLPVVSDAYGVSVTTVYVIPMNIELI